MTAPRTTQSWHQMDYTAAERDALTRLRVRHLTAAGTLVAATVAESSTSLEVSFVRAEPDTRYGVLATPDWQTAIWVTDKTTAGCTLNFDAPAPSGSHVDILTFRTED